MEVKELMNPGGVWVEPTATAALAARLLSRHNLGALPVCAGDGRLRGMVTDRDIVLRCVAAEEDPAQTMVRDIMTRSCTAVSPHADCRQAARLKLSRIPQGEPFGSPGKLFIIGAGQRSQLCKVRPPPLLDGLALEGKLIVQHFQQGCFFRIGALRRGRRAAQQRVFLLQSPDIAAVDGQVAGVKLAEGSVQKFSPPLRRALDQAQMPGVKDDSRKTACQACGPLGRCPVYRGCPARAWGIRCADGQADMGRVIRLLFVFLCTLGGRFQYRERFAPAHQLGILSAPEALAAGEQPDGLQQVRLTLAVVAADDGQLPAGGKAGGSDVPVILDFK